MYHVFDQNHVTLFTTAYVWDCWQLYEWAYDHHAVQIFPNASVPSQGIVRLWGVLAHRMANYIRELEQVKE